MFPTSEANPGAHLLFAASGIFDPEINIFVPGNIFDLESHSRYHQVSSIFVVLVGSIHGNTFPP